MTEGERGNVWFKEEQQTTRINQGVQGAHAAILFQCEDCRMVNLEGHQPVAVAGLDDTYVMCLHPKNLDAMGGRAVSTIGSHSAVVKRSVMTCRHICKTPIIPARGPMPMVDHLDMGIAVEMLFDSLTVQPRTNGQAQIQFDSMC